MADKKDNKSRMEGLGEFFGHIIKGVKTKPENTPASNTHEVKRTVEEERTDDGVILRRTTIDEVEIPVEQLQKKQQQRDADSDVGDEHSA